MAKLGLIYTGITCVVLILVQTTFFFVPPSLLAIFRWGIRPGIYALLLLGVVAFFGKDSRPIRKAYHSNIVAIIGLLLFGSMIIIVSVIFGGGRNAMMPSFWMILPNLWTMILPLCLVETVRYRLIKNTDKNNRIWIAFLLSFAFAFANLDELRMALNSENHEWISFFFESILPVLTASILVSIIAINGSLFSVLLISFVYNLGGTFSPLLPSIDRIAWSLVLYGMMFAVGILNYYLTDDNSAAQRKRVARTVKHTSGGPAKYIIGIPVSIFTIAFFLQVFAIYPVVILTGSMTGYIDMGSMVIMRRIPPDETLHRVQVGDVLHYRFRGIEVVHRVRDFTYDNDVRFYVTQGDANEFPDPDLLAMEDVLGTPIFTIPFVGYPNIIFRSIFGGIF
ncbi:MAG: signal peptidase I [Defluviitaleaceae bacterium]|nr:signal peptidase I [Defluviitaleaceae bacterium]